MLARIWLLLALGKWQCCVRVQVVKSESESESSPQSPSPSLSHHLRVRVRVRECQKKNSSPSHESSSPHIQHLFIFQNMKTNNKMYRMSESRHGRYCLDSGVTRARVTISESESKSKWKKLDSSPSPSQMDSSPSPYSSHTALASGQVLMYM